MNIEKQNPLKDVKVDVQNVSFDAERIIYHLLNGTDEGYQKINKGAGNKQNDPRGSFNPNRF